MAGRILVLDDEENYAEMLQDLLRQHNYQVDMATRPERAIDLLEEIPYDLVISDYKMPVMNGADFLKKARELYPNLPFILVSGLMNTPELVKVANMSVTLVMEKPLDTSAFLTHVARFSDPMTEEEKVIYARESEGAGVVADAYSYPDEPRFFNAGCAASQRAMQHAWNICQNGSHFFILEPRGGDGVLAVKDLSVWRKNLDRPVTRIDFVDFVSGGIRAIRGVLSDSNKSNVFAVRLESVEQISEAKTHLVQVLDQVGVSSGALFVYILEADVDKREFLELVDGVGCVLPQLLRRPTDVAQYARRFARMAAERSGKAKCASFSADAVYALLAFDWPENYKQLETVVLKAVAESSDAPLSLPVVASALGLPDNAETPAPERRLSSLMLLAQQCYVDHALFESGIPAETLARQLELDASVQNEADLHSMPLVAPKFAQL